ncbi:MAG: helix-turn-helix domain-containing protein [Methanoregulaceae archaeon]|jgi:predicted transcriptional regulator
MAENIVVLEPGEERAQKIAKAMASQTASDILRFIGEGPKTSTEISEYLSLPMNTAKYHIENLLDAGLISVEKTKYSVKGREVKVYGLTNQLLIVAPKESNIRSLFLKYVSLFAIVAFGSLVTALLSPMLGTSGTLSNGVISALRAPAPSQEVGGAYLKVASDSLSVAPVTSLDMAVAFLLGGCVVIIVLICYELYLWRKKR